MIPRRPNSSESHSNDILFLFKYVLNALIRTFCDSTVIIFKFEINFRSDFTIGYTNKNTRNLRNDLLHNEAKIDIL